MEGNNQIDTFWEAYNSSRCKTAMLVISLLVFAGVVISEVIGTPSELLKTLAIVIVGYWTGRTSKSKDKN